MLDGVDGRVARLIKGQSRFGAELDSLADFVNFGVAPALILYFWKLHELANVGWIAAMVFAIAAACAWRASTSPSTTRTSPAYAENFFTGVPAPAGALCVLLPIYLALLGLPALPAIVITLYMLPIAFLMVSRLPVFSGKKLGVRVPREMVLPVIVLVILVTALLIGYPRHVPRRHDTVSVQPAARLHELSPARAPSGGAGCCATAAARRRTTQARYNTAGARTATQDNRPQRLN